MVSLRSHLARPLTAGLFCLALLTSTPTPGQGADLVDQWLQSQTNLHTWSAEVTQTRALKSLTQPLVSQGRVWFSAPNLFRWEIGDPPRTIALRQPEQMLVIYPRLKRAERYPIDQDRSNPWKETLSLLETGFPRSRDDLQSRFRNVSQTLSNDLVQLTLEPKSSSARRLMPQLKIVFSTNDFLLRATELTFTDGSSMHNGFTEPKLNPKLDPELFVPDLGPDYKIVEPLAR